MTPSSLLALLIAPLGVAADLAAPRPAPPPSPPRVEEALAQVQRFYQRTRDYDADFKQTLTRRYHGPAPTRYGHVYLRKPGRMRWNYVDATGRITTQVVSDGETLWTYEPEDQQALKAPLKEHALPSAVTFLVGVGDLRKEFEGRLVPSSPYALAGDLALELVPRQASGLIKQLVLSVERASGEVRKTTMLQQNGDVNEITFTAPKRNTGLADERFRFVPPPGTRVLSGPAAAAPARPAP